MELHFTLTPLEVAEAIKPVAVPIKSRAARFVFGGLIGIGVVVAMFAFPDLGPGTAGQPAVIDRLFDKPGLQNLWAALIPTTIPLLYLLMALRIQRIKRRRLSRDPTEPMHHGSWAGVMISWPLLLFMVPLVRQIAIPWRPTPFEQTAVTVAPWVAALYGLIIVQRFRRAAGNKAVETSPGLLRPHVVTIEEGGFRSEDGLIDLRAHWDFFVRCRETANLLVLITEEVRAHIIPKRAIADPSDLIAIKAILQANIRQCEFLYTSTGFPVQPAPVAVIPVRA
jgi:hypothetical protein